MAVWQLSTRISGTVNGVPFSGRGSGTFDTETRLSSNRLVFWNFPGSYSPLLCRSWKCKHHPDRTPPQPYLSGNYDLDETVVYIEGAEGTILTRGAVRQTGALQSDATSTFDGTFSGPVAIESFPVHRETFTPQADGTYHITGYREAIIPGGNSVKTLWYGVAIPLGTPSTVVSYRLNYEYLSFNWQWGPQESIYEKTLRVTTELVPPANVRLLQAEDIPASLDIHYSRVRWLASRLRRPPESLPRETRESLERLIGRQDIRMVVVETGGRIVGFALATIEQTNDDLRFAPYGDILYLLVSPDSYGSGYESAMFDDLANWFRQHNVRYIRSTTYPQDPIDKALFKSLGFTTVAERIEKNLM